MKEPETTKTPDLAAAIDKAAKQHSPRCLEIDQERYQSHLDDPSLTLGQKVEIVDALWTIISSCVALGFGVHPVQQACGKHRTELDRERNSESTGVEPNNEKLHQETDAPAI